MKKKKTLKSSKSRAASPSSIAERTTLSKDVIMDIFSRLPTKSLCILRSVCKQWRIIIDDPFFKSLHRKKSSQKPNLLLLQEKSYRRCIIYGTSTTKLTLSSIDFEGNHNFDFTFTLDGYVNMLPSKSELICFVSTQGFYVCNPSTQELVKLPKSHFCDVKDGSAFGYIKQRNEYVLVNARCINYEIGCEVLRWTDDCCLKDCYWWVVSSKCPCYLRLWGILIENNCYWIGYNDKYDNTKIDAIVSFDLGKEEFSTVVLPEGRFDPAGVWFLVELKGLLCLVDSPEDESSMDIWVWKDSKNHIWAKEYIIDLSMFDFGFDFITPLDYREGKILMDVKFESLVWYDVEKKCFKKIDNLTSRRWSWSVLYTDGLFSLGSRYVGSV
ncbi:hypothetical protein AABB24_032599 [Solanum stoloniferum]|uniref:F-box domain-containing protein n=1 Tax=Solanum stoloniferum TaxID=62892 RepID=A0ABD2RLV5_9SOLN